MPDGSARAGRMGRSCSAQLIKDECGDTTGIFGLAGFPKGRRFNDEGAQKGRNVEHGGSGRGDRARVFGYPEAAEFRLQQALAEARAIGATTFELRIVTDIAALWIVAGRRAKAVRLLTPVYRRFTEGNAGSCCRFAPAETSAS